MVTRKDTQKGIEGEGQPEEMEEIEKVIGELFEEDVQENQPGIPTQPEPEVEVMVGDQPSKPTQKEDLSTQEMFRMLMEDNKRSREELNKKFESLQEGRKEDKEELNKKLEKLDQNLSLIHI